ncbi:hypothetical protein [Pediococcus parvulus]|uniref:hypothetical protein n=1 Tax=Pediococcus parvulus TaxID=54062 RepID=UPI0021A32951|nr:hypothetical protein [Pediococcus parvulus]MCT3031096.1 hypothetical protein [Pediococcus parvulus]MCT3035105.1 hypothetical protein [Pediococcus parvulus]
MQKIKLFFVLATVAIVGFCLPTTIKASDTTTSKPFPNNEILGVGSYFNAFAAGTMTIDANNTSNLEGRYCR